MTHRTLTVTHYVHAELSQLVPLREQFSFPIAVDEPDPPSRWTAYPDLAEQLRSHARADHELPPTLVIAPAEEIALRQDLEQQREIAAQDLRTSHTAHVNAGEDFDAGIDLVLEYAHEERYHSESVIVLTDMLERWLPTGHATPFSEAETATLACPTVRALRNLYHSTETVPGWI